MNEQGCPLTVIPYASTIWVSARTLDKLAKVLGVDASELIESVPDK
jgi:hypothetical protein